jgi:hypothetical protein
VEAEKHTVFFPESGLFTKEKDLFSGETAF